jgi:hypothetical protein
MKDFIKYCKNNDLKEIQKNIVNAELTISKYGNRALYAVVKHNNLDAVKLIISHKNFKHTDSIRDIVNYTIKNNYFELFKYLFNTLNFHIQYESLLHFLMYTISQYNRVKFIKYINTKKHISQIYNIYGNIDIAIRNKSIETFKYLYKTLKKKDVTYVMSHIRLAINYKLPEVVDFLIENKKTTFYKNIEINIYYELFFYSINFNKPKILKALISQLQNFNYLISNYGYRFNYSSNYRHLIQNKNNVLLKILLKNSKIQQKIAISDFYEYSMKYNNDELSMFIIKDVYSFHMLNYLLKVAIKHNNYNIIDFLIENSKSKESLEVKNLITASAKNITTFLYVFKIPVIKNNILKLQYSKIPTPLKTYLAGKFNVNTEERFKSIIEFL